jgi:hypothetical protein
LKPEPDCVEEDCFANVRRKVERESGRIQFGWSIWQHGKFFIEAEHHAVYEPSEGHEWIDITSQDLPIDRILFLPDESAVYEFNSDQRRDNWRMPLIPDGRVQAICDLFAMRCEMINSVPGVGAVSMPIETYRQIREAEMTAAALMIQLERDHSKSIGRNDPCVCGSFKKYKKCCCGL